MVMINRKPKLTHEQRIAAHIEAAQQAHATQQAKQLQAARDTFKRALLSPDIAKAAAGKAIDAPTLTSALLELAAIYEPDGKAGKAVLAEALTDKSVIDSVIEVLKGAGLVGGATAAHLRWCDLTKVEALAGSPRQKLNQVLNQRLLTRAATDHRYEVQTDGKVKIHPNPKKLPLTEEEKAAIREREAEAEHRKRMGIDTHANSEAARILEAAEIEAARIKAARLIQLESAKPWAYVVVGIIVLVWFINGVNNV